MLLAPGQRGWQGPFAEGWAPDGDRHGVRPARAIIVRLDGETVPVAPGKQRALLAALLLGAGRVVAVDELAEALWGPAPPVKARVTVQNYVMRLRKALGAGRVRISTRRRLPDQRGGRRARSPGSRRRWPQRGRRPGTAPGPRQRQAARRWLWRGEPLADVASAPLAVREVPRLAELRLQALGRAWTPSCSWAAMGSWSASCGSWPCPPAAGAAARPADAGAVPGRAAGRGAGGLPAGPRC